MNTDTDVRSWLKDISGHVCEKCGRPNVGTDRCPHAIDQKFMCPRDREARELTRKLRRLGL